MCGIIGYVGHRDAWPIILSGLQRLEYRGYDSAGIAVVTPSGHLEVRKSAGKVRELASLLKDGTPEGRIGLGHTRWATHGKPTDSNAHPHTDCKRNVVVVHNGIVENYLQLKTRLISKGHKFASETDTEVLAHLIEEGLDKGLDFEAAFLGMTAQVQGSQAIAATRGGDSTKQLIATRLGNAGGIVVAHSKGETLVSSDLPALLPIADSVIFLDDGETAIVTEDGVRFGGPGGMVVEKIAEPVLQGVGWVEKEGYKHFMLKEIMEQPRVAANAISGRVDFETGEVVLEDLSLVKDEIKKLQRVILIGCGTSLYAAMVGRYFMENLAGITAEVDSSSEFRYRNFQMDGNTLVISVGQSGETVDTLAAMATVRQKGGRLITICNAEGSQATRLAEATLYMRSGPEIGVASTKTFISSLSVLALLAVHFGQVRGTIDPGQSEEIMGELARLPNLLGSMLGDHQPYKKLARKYYKYDDFLFLGRGITYPIAMEGALKLKEISYIHAEGYPAGEMKHGPIALIDPNMPVVVVALQGSQYSKMANNIEEVKARDGVVIAVASEGDLQLSSRVDDVVHIPRSSEILTPLLAVVPLQLLAYYIAVRRGCDVDQPRNLAKSVTVE